MYLNVSVICIYTDTKMKPYIVTAFFILSDCYEPNITPQKRRCLDKW
jgi:hypothetical protein